MQSPSRRDALRGAAAAAAGALVLQPARQTMAATPEPQKVTPELIAAARKEGKVSFYTSVELPVAEKVAKAFEAKFPGIAVRVERSGAERNFQRIAQEYASKIYVCDITQSSDAAHFISWKRHTGTYGGKSAAAYASEPSIDSNRLRACRRTVT